MFEMLCFVNDIRMLHRLPTMCRHIESWKKICMINWTWGKFSRVKRLLGRDIPFFTSTHARGGIRCSGAICRMASLKSICFVSDIIGLSPYNIKSLCCMEKRK